MLDTLPPVIGVHGIKRSGKGTIAAYLVEHYGYQVVKLADPLKDMARVVLRRLCGLDEAAIERCIEGDLKEVAIPALGGKSCRYMMQMLGTEVRDLIDIDMWSNIASARIRSAIAEPDGRVVIDDIRFPHEVQLMRSLGALLLAVSSTHCAERALPQAGPLPWDGTAAPHFLLTPEVVQEMTGSLLRHCGVPSDEVTSYLDMRHENSGTMFSYLGFRSPLQVMAVLSNEFVALMRKPWTPSPASSAAHASEQMLPPGLFSAVITNNASFQDLYAQVDAAIAPQLVPAGPG